MAITRAQQAKQMLQDGGRIGLKGGADAATESFAISAGGGGQKGKDYAASVGARPDPKGGFDLGGGQGPTFDGAPATTVTGDEARKAKEKIKFAQSLRNDKRRRERRKRALEKRKLFQNISLRDKLMLDPTIRTLDDNLVDIGAIDDQGFTIGGVKVPSFITGAASAFTVDPSTKYFDEDSIREIGGVLSKSKTGITKSQADILGDIREDIDMRDRILDPDDRVSQEEFDTYINRNKIEFPDRDDGPIDPCKGPNPPAYCFIGEKADETIEAQRNLAGLTSRIGGSLFNFDGPQFAADGGRMGFFLGGNLEQSQEQKQRDINISRKESGGGGGDGPKGPPSVINPPPKEPVLKTRNILKGYNKHNINNQKLKNAVALGLISNDEYNILGGYDVNQTMGLDPFMTGVTSGLYNIYQTVKGDQPASEIYGDVKRNVEGSFGLPEELKTKYDNIMAMSSQEMTDQLADQKIAQMAEGGIAGLDREAFLLGGLAKGLKKAVRGVKKLVKSPIGKVALGAALFKFGGGLGGLKGKLFGVGSVPGVPDFVSGGGTMGILGKLGLTAGGGSLMPTALGGITLASLAAGAMTPKEDQGNDALAAYYAANRLDSNAPLNKRIAGSDFYGGRGQLVADGGRIGYQEGGDAEPVAKKTMPLLDMDGKEKDYRETGGFVDMGRMERADDVPARLSKNEFVFTADAVRNAGEGDIDKGAEVMYNMMKNLEAGGEVSEESQGLEGAREMFQTSQRLGEVI